MSLRCYFRRIVPVYCCFVFLLAGNICDLEAGDLEVFVIKPPEVFLPDIQRIAIHTFEGADTSDVRYRAFGMSMAGYLTTDLLEPNRGMVDLQKTKLGIPIPGGTTEGFTLQKGARTDVYTILERTQFDKILDEHKKVLAGLTPDEYAIRIGQLAGVQAMVVGSLSFSSNEKKKTKERDGQKISGQERTVSVRVTANMVNAETGNTIASKTFARKCKSERYDDGSGSGLDPFEVIGWDPFNKDRCPGGRWGVEEIVEYHLSEISSEFAEYIAPTFVLQKYDIENVDFKGELKKFESCAKEAKAFAEKGEVDEAYATYIGLYNQNQFGPKLNYNLGVLSEVVGHFDAANEYYQVAAELKPKEKRFREAVERIERTLELRETLVELGIEIEEHSWPQPSDCGDDKWVKVTEDECRIYEASDFDSPVITPIPKDVRLRYLAKENEWYLIQLPRSEQKGYIHQGMAKLLN